MKHPMQYVVDGRFVENKLITRMLEHIGHNEVSQWSSDDADYDQLLQLIGYSTSGIPYRDKDKYEITDDNFRPEDVFERKYKELKKDLAPIMAELFNHCEEDLL